MQCTINVQERMSIQKILSGLNDVIKNFEIQPIENWKMNDLTVRMKYLESAMIDLNKKIVLKINSNELPADLRSEISTTVLKIQKLRGKILDLVNHYPSEPSSSASQGNFSNLQSYFFKLNYLVEKPTSNCSVDDIIKNMKDIEKYKILAEQRMNNITDVNYLSEFSYYISKYNELKNNAIQLMNAYSIENSSDSVSPSKERLKELLAGLDSAFPQKINDLTAPGVAKGLKYFEEKKAELQKITKTIKDSLDLNACISMMLKIQKTINEMHDLSNICSTGEYTPIANKMNLSGYLVPMNTLMLEFENKPIPDWLVSDLMKRMESLENHYRQLKDMISTKDHWDLKEAEDIMSAMSKFHALKKQVYNSISNCSIEDPQKKILARIYDIIEFMEPGKETTITYENQAFRVWHNGVAINIQEATSWGSRGSENKLGICTTGNGTLCSVFVDGKKASSLIIPEKWTKIVETCANSKQFKK